VKPTECARQSGGARAAVATNIAYILFVVAIVLFVVHLISGRRLRA
jgi:uncharacterized membrane protein YtjA (UPF0391 family)